MRAAWGLLPGCCCCRPLRLPGCQTISLLRGCLSLVGFPPPAYITPPTHSRCWTNLDCCAPATAATSGAPGGWVAAAAAADGTDVPVPSALNSAPIVALHYRNLPCWASADAYTCCLLPNPTLSCAARRLRHCPACDRSPRHTAPAAGAPCISGRSSPGGGRGCLPGDRWQRALRRNLPGSPSAGALG